MELAGPTLTLSTGKRVGVQVCEVCLQCLYEKVPPGPISDPKLPSHSRWEIAGVSVNSLLVKAHSHVFSTGIP